MKILSILAENSLKTKIKLSRNVLFHMEVSFKYFVNGCRGVTKIKDPLPDQTKIYILKLA